jgi:type II secretory pathway component GspD/PulD (secretin)
MNSNRSGHLRRATLTLALAIAALAPPAPARAVTLNLHQRIDLNVSDCEVGQLFRVVGQLTGAQIEIDPRLKEATRRVSIRIDNVSIRTALNAICESIDCRWLAKDDVIVVTALTAHEPKHRALLDEPIDLRVQDAPLHEVMHTLATILGAELTFDEALAGVKLTLDVENHALAATLDAACAQAGCKWKLIPAGAKPSLQVTAK